MSDKYSIWQAAEDMVGADYIWIIEGPWIDAEGYEDTLDSALAHLQLCCEAVVDDYDGVIRDDIEWLDCRDDVGLLETLLDNMEPDHRWYNDLRELVFMNMLAGA
jgi:hypothetical protein